ncbi:hypothetical protein NUSPORA_02289 [Nucleospora cyclopteri]
MPEVNCNYHSRNERRKECKNDINDRKHSNDSKYHPLKLEREYVRASNATKIDKFMAKPFISAYTLHDEGINKLAAYKNNFLTSNYSNEVVLWNLKEKNLTKKFCMENLIKAISISKENIFIAQNNEVEVKGILSDRNETIMVGQNVNSLDVTDKYLAVGTFSTFYKYDLERSYSPIYQLRKGCKEVKINQSFGNVVGIATETDITLQDTRTNQEIAKIEMEAQCLEFYENKMSVGSKNALKIFDLRMIEKAENDYKFTNTVLSVAMKNTKIFSAGTSDSTIHLFNKENKISDTYYNDKMGMIYGLRYSSCGNYLISASDDGNLRLWKANANEKTVQSYRERKNRQINWELQEKFKDVAEIKRIKNHKFLPKEIKNKLKQMKESKKNK